MLEEERFGEVPAAMPDHGTLLMDAWERGAEMGGGVADCVGRAGLEGGAFAVLAEDFAVCFGRILKETKEPSRRRKPGRLYKKVRRLKKEDLIMDIPFRTK